MSSNVEERVVEMRFDNAKFEKNAQQTIKTLNALDKSLDLKSSTKGFEDLEKAANSVDLSHLEKSLDFLANKFTLFGKIGDKILTDLSHKFVNFFEKVSKSFTTDQIRSGWDKYEAKTNAVQVIMHATKLSIDEVSAALDDLTKYTDETSYRFDQMVDAISKFTAAGVELGDAELMAEGIANWAASAGVNPQKAAGAFYNLAQAVSSGSLRAQDWKSIELLNMNTQEFEETAIRVAKEMIEDGRASKEMAAAFKKANPQVKGFRDSLSSGWFDQDVMREVFKEYGDITTDVGREAFKAAREAKTFTDAVEAAKDAVSSGWATVFEQIFGNYEEAKVFWTEVADAMIDTVSAPISALANFLKEWHSQGGYIAFINSIRNAWDGVKAIGEAVRDVFRSIFPALDPANLVKWTQKLEEVTGGWVKSLTKIDISELNKELEELYANGDTEEMLNRLTEAEEHNAEVDKKLSPLKDTLQGIFSIIKLSGAVTKALFKIVLPFTKLLVPIARLVGVITGALGRMASAVADAILNSEAFNGLMAFLAKVTDKATTAINWLADKLVWLIDNALHIPIVETFVGLISQLVDTIREFAAPYFTRIGNTLSEWYNSAKKFVELHFPGFLQDVADGLAAFGEAVIVSAEAIWNWLQPAISVVGSFLSKVWKIAESIGGKIKNYWNTVIVPSGVLNYIMGRLREVGHIVKSLGASLLSAIKGGGIGAVFQWIKDKISEIWKLIRTFNFRALLGDAFKVAKIGGIVGGLFALYKAFKLISNTAEAVASFPKAVSSFSNSLKSFSKGIAIKRVAEGILMIAGACYLLSKIPADRLWEVIGALGAIASALVIFTLAMSFVTGLLSKKGLIDNKAMGKATTGMIKMAVAVLLLSIALQKIADIDSDKLKAAVQALLEIMLVMSVSMMLLSTSGKTVLMVGVGFAALALALLVIIAAIWKLKDAFDKLKDNSVALNKAEWILGIIAIGLTAISLILTKVKTASWELAATIVAIGAAIWLIAVSVKKLAELDPDNFNNAILALVGLLGALTLVALISRIFPEGASKKILGIAAVILSIGVSMLLLTAAIKKLGEMDSNTVSEGLGRLSVIMLALIPVLLAAGVVRGGIGGFLGLAAVILVLVGALRFLAEQDFEKILKAATLLSAVMVALGAALLMGSIALRGNIGAKLGVVLIIISLVGALWFLTTIPMDKLLGAVAALSSVFVALGASAIWIGLGSAVSNTSSLYAMAVMIGIIGGVLWLIGQLPVANALVAAGVLESILAELTVVIAIISKVTSKIGKDTSWKTIAKQSASVGLMVAALVLPIVGAMWALSAIANNYSVSTVSAVAGILVVLIAELAIVVAAMAKIPSESLPNLKDSVKIGAVITAVLLPIVAALAAAKWLIPDPKGLITIATAIAEVVTALIIPIATIMKFGQTMSKTSFGGGLLAAVEFGLIFAVITAILAGIGELVNLFNSEDGNRIISDLETAAVVATAVGEAIGGLIGGLVGGLVAGGLDAIVSMLPSWGEDIATFFANIKSGVASINEVEIDKNKSEALESLAKAMLAFTASSVIEGLTSWIAGEVSFEDFGEGIAALGPGLATFANDTKGINADDVKNASMAIGYLADAASSLPRDGGLWQDLVGHTKSLGEFANELNAACGEDGNGGFVKFAKEVAPVLDDYKDKIESAVGSIDALAEVSKNLGRNGGLIEAALGKPTTLSEFSSELIKSAPDFVDFGQNYAPEIADQEEAIRSTAGTMQALVDVANALKPKNTEVLWGAYKTEAQNLGEFISMFADQVEDTGSGARLKKGIGTNLKNFAQNIEGLTAETFDPMISVLVGLTNVGNALNGGTETKFGTIGNFSLYESSTQTLGTWLDELVSTSGKLKEFAEVFADDRLANLISGTSVLSSLVGLEERLAAFKDSYYQLPNIANNLLSVAEDMEEASDVAGRIGYSAIDAMLGYFSDNLESILTADSGKILEMLGEMATEGLRASQGTADIVVDSLVTKLKSASQRNKFYNAGIYLVTGFVDGIKSQLTKVENAGFNLSERVVTAMRRALRIESPSKVMRRIGDYTGEGFVLGIEDYIGASEVAGTELAESATNSAIGVLDYIQDLLNGDLSVDMTIRPVLDLTNVQYGMQQIDSMFSRRQAILAQADADAFSNSAEIAELISVSWKILREIQNGRDIYLDGRIVSNVVNERLGRMEG